MDLEHLQQQVLAGQRPRFLFFWSHRPRTGGIDRSCLSQWHPSAFELDGELYPTAEHFMMAEKARLFGDEEMQQRILDARSPGEAKQLGRAVRGFELSIWEAHRRAIVTAGNRARFEQNPGLLAFLLGTRRRVLVEASPRDRIWGIGLDEHDERAHDPCSWRGLNLLGFALMDVREALS